MRSKRTTLFLVAAALLLTVLMGAGTAGPVAAISPDIVISQVYGGGGNSGAPYTHDFVELFNRSAAPVSLAGWSIQYASATGTGNFSSNPIAILSGSLDPGQYYLVQLAGGTNGVALPTPDATGTVNMGATAGKVVLVGTTTGLACNGGSTPCTPEQLALIIDLVGWGSANFFETAPAPATSNTTSISRNGNGCMETDDNAADFTAGSPNPRNSASPLNSCATAAPVLVINEIMQNPAAVADSAGEWFELYNPTAADIDINGWTIADNGSDSHVINNGGPLLVPAGGYLVLGNNTDPTTNGGLTVAYSYGGSWFLANGDDEVVLFDTSGAEVDRVEYDGGPQFPDPNGASMALIDPALDNNVGANWCTASTPYGAGDLGTPGAANDCATAAPVLVINEIMQNPAAVADSAGEWFELYNPTAADIDINGWTIADNGSDSHVINNGGPLLVPAGGYLVLGNNTDPTTNGGLTVAYSYGGSWFLANGDDEVVLFDTSGAEVDRVEYDGGPQFPDPNGASMALIDPALDNNVGANWCTASTPYGAGDLGTPGAANDCAPPPPPEMCGDPYTFIYDVQGTGLVSPLVGTTVSVEGVVVGDFQNNGMPDNGDLNGFHVQDPLGDGNPLSSDGIFIYAPGGIDVMTGHAVRVRGGVSEFFGMTQITAGQIWICGTGPSITPTAVSLPVTAVEDWEKYEGMLVTFPQSLVISEYFNFDRFGEIVLTTDRRMTPTAVVEPGPDAVAMAQDYLLNRITLDDGRSSQNPDPAIHPNGLEFNLDNLFRGGDLVTNVTGVLDFAFNLYRIQPTQGADYTPVNHRPAAPDPVGGNIKVASFNVLNYFTTIDTGAPICGPLGNQGCRGADTVEEFHRQRMKIITATAALDADVIGLIEIENHPGDVPTADLVSGLNDLLGAGTYDYIATGAIGTDAIRVALIYRPAHVTPIGDYAVLDTSVDPRFLDAYNRPVLAQTFLDNDTGGVVTVAVNHLKSKGSSCDAIGDPDLGDGAGNCNLTRLAAAQAQVDWLESDPTGLGAGNYLIIGDLNSYDKEDPIDAILAGSDDVLGTADDYTDLLYHFVGEYAYSYVFDGQIGYLDYGMASAGLLGQVTGATAWHINADEADLIDYDMTFKQDAQDAIYAPDAYRSSDHDPVIVGLQLEPAARYVTGGGWINSPAGAYPDDPALTGRATFGFVALYADGMAPPVGSVEFRFAPANMNFRSTGLDWLVVSGWTATFAGTGAINGQGEYQFMVTAGDGTGTNGADTFQIRIWYVDEFGNEVVVYDNGPNWPITRGSIVIHEPDEVDAEFAVRASGR
jgi:predicted extracellular nuclease